MDTSVILIICLLIARATSLSCDCDWQHKDTYCGPPPKCSSPLVNDACGCCQVCSKVHGEKCGGPWGIYGKCAPGLECKTTGPIDSVGAGGIFGHSREPIGTCLVPGEVIQKTQPCYIALNNYQTQFQHGGHRGRRQATGLLSKISTTSFTKDSEMTTPSDLTTQSGDLNTSPVVMVTGDQHTTDDGGITTQSSIKISNEITTTETVTKGITSDMTSAEVTHEITTVQSIVTSSPADTTSSGTTGTTIKPCPVKPRCTPEGWFAPTQCDPCTGQCWCVEYNTGVEIPNTRTQGRAHCNHVV